MNKPRVAILIDAENIPHHCCDEIMRQAQFLGQICARRVYGNDFSWTSWSSHAGKHALKHISTHHESVGRKNAADISLMLDAVSLAHSGQYDAMCLVSNDGDFLQMVLHLREQGFKVFGLGTQVAAHQLRNALDRFMLLETQEQHRQEQHKDTEKGKRRNTTGRDSAINRNAKPQRTKDRKKPIAKVTSVPDKSQIAQPDIIGEPNVTHVSYHQIH